MSFDSGVKFCKWQKVKEVFSFLVSLFSLQTMANNYQNTINVDINEKDNNKVQETVKVESPKYNSNYIDQAFEEASEYEELYFSDYSM